MRAGTLVVDIAANVARLQQDMASAKGIVAGAMNDITRSVNVAKGALGALGAGLSVGALTSMAAGIVRANAALDDMAEVTGSTVEHLSRFSVVAKIGSHDMGMVEDALVKLTKGLKGTEEETKNASSALGFLGVQAKDAFGKLRDPGEIMREVAGKLSQFEDGAGKTALALDLFGKSGAKLLPFLKDMAEEGSVAARVTAAQAAEAEKLEKNLNRLKIAGEDSKREIVMGMTPAIVEFTEKLLIAQRATGNLVAALAMLANTDVSNVGAELKEVERQLARRESAIATTDRMGLYGLSAVSKIGAGVFQQRRNYLLGVQRQQANAMDGPENYDARDLRLRTKVAADYTGAAGKPGGGGATGKTAADVLNEAAGVSKDFFKDLQLLHGEYARGKISLDQYSGAVEKLIEKQAFAKEAARQEEEIRKSANQAAEAYAKQNDKQIETIEEATRSLRLRSKEIDAETQLVGASAAEREKANEFLKIENMLRQASINLTPEQISALHDLAAAEKVRIGAAIDGKLAREEAHKASEEAAKQWKESFERTSQDIERALTDSIMRGGKSALDYLQDIFRTAVLSPILRPVAQGITGMVQSTFGLGGSGGGGGFGGIGVGDILSGAKSIFGGGAGLTGSAVSAEIAMLTGSGVSTAGALGGGALAGIGSALPWIGGGLLVANALGLFDEGGGPKPSEIGLFGGSGGAPFFIGQNNMAGGEANLPMYNTINAQLNDRGRYDPKALAQFSGQWRTLGDDPASAMQQLLQLLAPAVVDINKLLATQQSAQVSLAQISKSLPDTLGITALGGFQASLATSEYVSPMARLAAARAQYDSTASLALGGDLGAIQSFSGQAQQLLGIGRDVYASGGGFQDLFRNVNTTLQSVLDLQRGVQADVMRDVPLAIRETGLDQIKAIRDQTAELTASLRRVEDELVRVRAAQAAG